MIELKNRYLWLLAWIPIMGLILSQTGRRVVAIWIKYKKLTRVLFHLQVVEAILHGSALVLVIAACSLEYQNGQHFLRILISARNTETFAQVRSLSYKTARQLNFY